MEVPKEVVELFEQYRKTVDVTITKMPEITAQFQEGFIIMRKLVEAGFMVERETVSSKEVTEVKANGDVVCGREQKIVLSLHPLSQPHKEPVRKLEATTKIYPEFKKMELLPQDTTITDGDRDFLRGKIKL